MDIIVLSRSDDPHVHFLSRTFNRRGIEALCLYTDELYLNGGVSYSSQTNKVDYVLDEQVTHDPKPKSIWYRRPGMPNIVGDITDSGIRAFCEREAEAAILGSLHLLDVVWVNAPDKISVAKHKMFQLSLAQKLGLKVAPTYITNRVADVKRLIRESPNGVVYKPLTWGVAYPEERVDGVAIPTTRIDDVDLNLAGVAVTPGIYQSRLQKKKEIRVTIFGTKVFAVAIDVAYVAETDIRSQIHLLGHSVVCLPTEIENACRKMMNYYGLLFAAIDLVLTPNDEYYFLEINPNGQWAWIEKKTGLPLSDALVDLLLKPHL